MARGGQGRRTVIGIGERFFFLRGVLFVLFNQYWGIVTFPGGFIMSEPKRTHARLKIADDPCSPFKYWIVCCFVFLFVGIKPENPYFASRPGLEVKLLGVYPLEPRRSSCGPIKGTPPPRLGNTLCAN